MTDAATLVLRIRPARWLGASALAYACLCLATGVVLSLRGLSGIPVYYFYAQDAGLLIAVAITLLLLSRVSPTAPRPWAISTHHLMAFIGLAAAFAYAGTWLVMLRYPMSRDEALAEFTAQHLLHGQWGWPIPAALRPLAKALMPVWTDSWTSTGFWASDYLPVNAAFRAVAGHMGDTWLASPVLLAIGMVALWFSARRLWPDSAEPAAVVVILGVTSTQLLVNAMTPYAMTGHFALNALWLACFLRGGRLGHGFAIVIGILATGLHQFHFHLMFVSGFIVWAWLSGRRTLALTYVMACVGYHVIWHNGYHQLLLAELGTARDVAPASTLAPSWISVHLDRLRELEPFSSFARFAAWQNILMLPLAALGVTRIPKSCGSSLPIAFALQVTCLFALATMVYQGLGYGYRYLNGTLPCFLLLAGGGWVRLTNRREDAISRTILFVAAAFALCVTLPFALWQSHSLLRPYAMAFSTARSAPADVVLVDGRGGGLLQDIVRINGRIERPLLLDLGYVPRPTLRQLCANRRVMLFDQRQAKPLGIMGTGTGDQKGYRDLAAANRALIAELRCDTPVPLRIGS